MKSRFPYDYLPPLEIPDKNLIGIYEAGQQKPTAVSEEIVKRSLDNPIGALPLAELAEEIERVLILCDDNTRYTPAYLVIPYIIDELHSGGVTDENISFLIASGTHRLMTESELIAKLGKSVVDKFLIEQHVHNDLEELVPVGKRMGDVEFLVNKRLRDADLVIGVGNIVPHMYKGFSGGSNIILPGVSGEDSIAALHWLSLESPVEDILGVRENPPRLLIDEVARKAGLNYIVNTIVNNDLEIIDAVAGDPVEAHRVGAKAASHIFSVDIPEKADIVIFDAYENDLDFWQANKGLNSAYVCLKPGGVVIMIADCPEGACNNVPDVGRYGFRDIRKIMELHEKGILHPIISHFLIATNRIIIEHSSCISVTRGISKEEAEHVGFIYAETPSDALNKAFLMKGPDATITVLRHAGNMCPRIGK
jgi:lactate racemase